MVDIQANDAHGRTIYRFAGSEIKGSDGKTIYIITDDAIRNSDRSALYRFHGGEIKNSSGDSVWKYTDSEIKDVNGLTIFLYNSTELRKANGGILFKFPRRTSLSVLFALGLIYFRGEKASTFTIKFTLPVWEAGKSDITFFIRKDEEKPGELKFTEGSAAWFPTDSEAGNRIAWPKMGNVFIANGREIEKQ